MRLEVVAGPGHAEPCKAMLLKVWSKGRIGVTWEIVRKAGLNPQFLSPFTESEVLTRVLGDSYIKSEKQCFKSFFSLSSYSMFLIHC